MIVRQQKSKRLIEKITSFADVVLSIASLSQSSKLKVGCIIFSKDFSTIASIGYNGNMRNYPINPDTGTTEDSLESGKSGFIHAEINAIAKFNEKNPQEYIVLITHSPCEMCAKVLINAGFNSIYWLHNYRETGHISKLMSINSTNYGNLYDLYVSICKSYHIIPLFSKYTNVFKLKKYGNLQLHEYACIVLGQDWHKNADDEYVGTGWFEPDGYVMGHISEYDKNNNPIVATFVKQAK